MKENRLGWFGHVERRNNDDIIKKKNEIRIDGSRRRGSPKKKWMEDNGGKYEDMWSRWKYG